MGNRIEAAFGDRLAAGDALPERAIRNPFESGLYHPDLRQSRISKALQNLVAFPFRSTFLEICIGRLLEFYLDPR